MNGPIGVIRPVVGNVRKGAATSAPPAPTAQAASNVLDTSFTANWSSVAGATEYRLDVSTASNFSSFVSGYQDKAVAGTSQSVTGLTAGTTYYYRVRAVKGKTSENSNTITTYMMPIASPVMFYAGDTFTANGNNITAIPDLLDLSNENKKFKEPTDPFTIISGFPGKDTQAKKLTIGQVITMSANQYSVIFAGRIIGGSTAHPVVMSDASNGNICIDAPAVVGSSAVGGIGSNIGSSYPNNVALQVHPNDNAPAAPFDFILIWSYDKNTSDNRSGYYWTKKDGNVVTSTNIITSNNSINTLISQLGRSTNATNYAQFIFYHLSTYNKLLTADEMASAITYLTRRFSL